MGQRRVAEQTTSAILYVLYQIFRSSSCAGLRAELHRYINHQLRQEERRMATGALAGNNGYANEGSALPCLGKGSHHCHKLPSSLLHSGRCNPTELRGWIVFQVVPPPPCIVEMSDEPRTEAIWTQDKKMRCCTCTHRKKRLTIVSSHVGTGSKML